jgi:hypothetical protein
VRYGVKPFGKRGVLAVFEGHGERPVVAVAGARLVGPGKPPAPGARVRHVGPRASPQRRAA